ncbi:hypothetical protein BDV93DRAFT_520452 [Ceratobasidium sp. AG-I]|nr:hypothetical protein BDV93DRAFT_520452 [Ceratobasidium sp. AG-I]
MLQGNLSAWITDSTGNPLEEYKTNTTEPDTVECWIPSTEGSNFRIRWQSTQDFEPDLGLRCAIKLDGRRVSSGSLSPSQVARGIWGDKDGMSVPSGMRRLFVFCGRNLTDQDDLASPDDPRRADFGTIQVALQWVYYTNITLRHKPGKPKEAGLVHERAVKKGHRSAVDLTDPVPSRRKSGTTRYKLDASLPLARFTFRYGPEEWLRAKGIIDAPLKGKKRLDHESAKQKRKSSPNPFLDDLEPSGSSVTKRLRAYDPADVIDIDDLESDGDSDVVVLSDPVGVEFTTPRGLNKTLRREDS